MRASLYVPNQRSKKVILVAAAFSDDPSDADCHTEAGIRASTALDIPCPGTVDDI
jgi:hypothetical protein